MLRVLVLSKKNNLVNGNIVPNQSFWGKGDDVDNLAKSSFFLIMLNILTAGIASSDRDFADCVNGPIRGTVCPPNSPLFADDEDSDYDHQSRPKNPTPKASASCSASDVENEEENEFIRQISAVPGADDAFEDNPEETKASLWDLIKNGRINAVCDMCGSTPLHVAAALGDEDLVKALLAAGAKQLVFNNAKNTPLHVAVLRRQVAVVKLLLPTACQSVRSHRNLRDQTPCNIAHRAGYDDILELLRS